MRSRRRGHRLLALQRQFRRWRRDVLRVAVQLADEDGILAFAVFIAGPEVELVFGSRAGLGKDQGFLLHGRLGLRQVKRNHPDQPVMTGDDEDGLPFREQVLPRVAHDAGDFGITWRPTPSSVHP